MRRPGARTWRRDHVMIEGRDEAHPEGSYFLEFWDQGRRKREAVGPDAFVAAERAKHRRAELSAIRSGLIETPVIVESPDRTKLSDALDKYTDFILFARDPMPGSKSESRSYRTCVDVVKRKQALSFSSFDTDVIECRVVPARADADHATSVRMVL
jgi:hypothetical protein